MDQAEKHEYTVALQKKKTEYMVAFLKEKKIPYNRAKLLPDNDTQCYVVPNCLIFLRTWRGFLHETGEKFCTVLHQIQTQYLGKNMKTILYIYNGDEPELLEKLPTIKGLLELQAFQLETIVSLDINADILANIGYPKHYCLRPGTIFAMIDMSEEEKNSLKPIYTPRDVYVSASCIMYDEELEKVNPYIEVVDGLVLDEYQVILETKDLTKPDMAFVFRYNVKAKSLGKTSRVPLRVIEGFAELCQQCKEIKYIKYINKNTQICEWCEKTI